MSLPSGGRAGAVDAHGHLAELGLEPKAAKTRIVHLVEQGEGFDFLGFHHRLVRARGRAGAKRLVFLARWPHVERPSMPETVSVSSRARSRLLVPVEEVVGTLNRFLRGWAGCFRIGNSALVFDKVRSYPVERLAIFVATGIGEADAGDYVEGVGHGSRTWRPSGNRGT